MRPRQRVHDAVFFLGVSKPEDHAMHASAILQRCLSTVLGPMHAARARRLLGAVEALVAGRRLTLTDLARSWPEATWMHAPLKALDRLLSNRHVHDAVVPLHQAMAVWLLSGRARPLVLVDWSDLKGDGRWALLRASVPVGGRALTLYEQTFPRKRMGQPKAQLAFLRQLRRVVPQAVAPIIVTDAGFRSDWLRAVQSLGWDYIGRLRNNTHVRSVRQRSWRACSILHGSATHKALDLGEHFVVKGDPVRCRLVLVSQRRKGREQLTRSGKPQQGLMAKKARKSAREPWLLMTSLTHQDYTAHQVVAGYSKRMQIEEAFRDLKSHRYGSGFEDSLTRKPKRLAVLLLLQSLAAFAAWVMGHAAEEAGAPDPLARQSAHHGRYSLIRRGIEWLGRATVPLEIARELRRLCTARTRIVL